MSRVKSLKKWRSPGSEVRTCVKAGETGRGGLVAGDPGGYVLKVIGMDQLST